MALTRTCREQQVEGEKGSNCGFDMTRVDVADDVPLCAVAVVQEHGYTVHQVNNRNRGHRLVETRRKVRPGLHALRGVLASGPRRATVSVDPAPRHLFDWQHNTVDEIEKGSIPQEQRVGAQAKTVVFVERLNAVVSRCVVKGHHESKR